MAVTVSYSGPITSDDWLSFDFEKRGNDWFLIGRIIASNNDVLDAEIQVTGQEVSNAIITPGHRDALISAFVAKYL